MTDWLDWHKMFQGVQEIAQRPLTHQEGLYQAIAFARRDPLEYHDAGYWDQAEHSAPQMPYATVQGWARQGLEALDMGREWGLLVLDLGDCPEEFHLYQLGCQPSLVEGRFQHLLHSKTVIHLSELEGCVESEANGPTAEAWETVPDDDAEDINFEEGKYPYEEPGAGSTLYSAGLSTLVSHNVQCLGDAMLTWNVPGTEGYYGNNGYLLWLAFASLALLAPLCDLAYCKRILGGRQRLYLLSGFEEIFFHLATVTPVGLTFKTG